MLSSVHIMIARYITFNKQNDTRLFCSADDTRLDFNITVTLTLYSVLVMLDLYKGVTASLKWQIPHLYKRLAMVPLQNNQALNDSKYRVELTLLGDVLEELA